MEIFEQYILTVKVKKVEMDVNLMNDEKKILVKVMVKDGLNYVIRVNDGYLFDCQYLALKSLIHRL